MIFNSNNHGCFREMSVFEMDRLDKCDVQLLGFCELKFVRVVKVDGCSESTSEVGYTVGDSCVRMKHVRWNLEKEVLAKYSVRNKSSDRITDELVDASIDTWKCERVVVFQEPADREQSAGDILTVVDTIGWRLDPCNASDMSQSNADCVFLTSAKIEGSDRHWIGCNFKDVGRRVRAARVPVSEWIEVANFDTR